MRYLALICMLGVMLFSGALITAQAQTGSLDLPPGFSISVYASGVSGARSLTVGDDGTVFVGSRIGNRITALVDSDGDFRADQTYTIGANLNVPNGVAFYDGDLYVAELSRILRYEDIESQLAAPPAPVIVRDDLPRDAHHGWKYLAIGPDEKLYFAQGAPCDLCSVSDPYGTMRRMNLDGSNLEIIARGIRNTVGFDWHPVTGELWFTDNGPDGLGDNQPGDELNRIESIGQHFGFPVCHAGELVAAGFGQSSDCLYYEAPVQVLGPHVAALGMLFYTGDMFPEAYQNQVIIAEHGSWSRSTRLGYRLMLVTLDDDGVALSYAPFVTGWLDDATQNYTGRPVDLAQLPDGSLLVSDDHAGVIYRIAYDEEQVE